MRSKIRVVAATGQRGGIRRIMSGDVAEHQFDVCPALPASMSTLGWDVSEQHLDVLPAQHFSRTLNSLCVYL